VHRTVFGAPTARNLQRSASPNKERDPHRTVSGGAPDYPVSQQSAGPTVGRIIRARRVARANGQKGHRSVRCAPECPVCTGQCPVRQRLQSANGRLRQRRKEICTGQCPVRQATEGKNCLPGMLSTAPSCLEAVKGTPRRMEENTKHSLSIVDHSHFILAHLFDILSDLSSVLVRT
jgi:hypothetical protein